MVKQACSFIKNESERATVRSEMPGADAMMAATSGQDNDRGGERHDR
jgi:hypothetical protein